MLGAAVLVTALAWDGHLSRPEGLLMVLTAVVYTVAVVRLARRERASVVAEYEREYAPVTDRRAAGRALAVNGLLLTVGILVVVLGADLLVDGAVGIARSWGVSEALIGLTIVAIGTSAPELVTTMVSTARGDRDIAVGNLLGSSIFNLLLILGVTVVVPAGGVAVEHDLTRVDLPVVVGVALLCLPAFRTGQRVSRPEGGALVALYVGYVAYLVLART